MPIKRKKRLAGTLFLGNPVSETHQVPLDLFKGISKNSFRFLEIFP